MMVTYCHFFISFTCGVQNAVSGYPSQTPVTHDLVSTKDLMC